MSRLIVEQNFCKTKNNRECLIKSLRSALNAAEQGEDEVSIIYDNLEITWNLEDGELFVEDRKG